MSRRKYKIIFINKDKESAREFNFSRILFTSFLFLTTIFFSFSILYFFSESYVTWAKKMELENYKKKNKNLVESVNDAKKKMDDIDRKLKVIIDQDNTLRKFVKLPAIHEDVRKLGTGGDSDTVSSKETSELLPGTDFDLNELIQDIYYVNRLLNLEILSYQEIVDVADRDQEKLRHYPAIYPVPMDKAKLASRYGYRIDPIEKRRKFHDGDDFSAKQGTPVYATADGKIIRAGWNGSFGNYIEIDHGWGYRTVYGHLKNRSLKVKKGQKVSRGDVIAAIGNTGRSTAPHLHYEVKRYKKRYNPSDFYFDS